MILLIIILIKSKLIISYLIVLTGRSVFLRLIKSNRGVFACTLLVGIIAIFKVHWLKPWSPRQCDRDATSLRPKGQPQRAYTSVKGFTEVVTKSLSCRETKSVASNF